MVARGCGGLRAVSPAKAGGTPGAATSPAPAAAASSPAAASTQSPVVATGVPDYTVAAVIDRFDPAANVYRRITDAGTAELIRTGAFQCRQRGRARAAPTPSWR